MKSIVCSDRVKLFIPAVFAAVLVALCLAIPAGTVNFG